ncbi:MAG: helix-turn-helix transcriptional regulator [Gemmatimonadales bacterium]|nr:helix-turn-helix transcriptional regulator [Gemmatimonadales bacterium]
MCERLRAARERAGLTQVEAADALSRPQNFVSKCETAERRIDAIELAEFAELYNVAIGALIPPPTGASGASRTRLRRVAEPTRRPTAGKPRS